MLHGLVSINMVVREDKPGATGRWRRHGDWEGGEGIGGCDVHSFIRGIEAVTENIGSGLPAGGSGGGELLN